MELGGRLFDDLFFQWFLDQNPGVLKTMEKAGDTYYVHAYLCREAKEFFSLTMARDRSERVNKSVGRYGSLRGMDWDGFIERAKSYLPSPTFILQMESMGVRAQRILQRKQSIDLIDWFRTTLSHGLAEKGVATDQISRVILAGGSSQWPFVSDVVTETLGIDRSRLMRSDRPYAVISQGLAILPALQKNFEQTRDKLRRDLPRFCQTRVRPLAQRVTDNYVAGVASDVTSELFDRTIRPIVEEFREKGGSVKTLRESIAAQVKANEGKLRAILDKRMHTLQRGLPGELNELLREWFESYGLSVGEKPIAEAQRRMIGQEIVQPDTPDLYSGIMDTVGWFVVALATAVGASISGGGGMALVAAGPVGWITGAIIGAAVAFLAIRYGMSKAKELADTWNAPAWIVKNVLLPSRIARMRGDFQSRLKETLQSETRALQDELESRIRQVTERQVEGLSEVAQL